MGNNLNKFTFMRERLVIYQTLTRGEQPDEGVEVDEKNDQIALRRTVAGREILRNAKMAIRQRQVYGFFASCRNCAFSE